MGNVIVVHSGVACEEAGQRGGQLPTTTAVLSNSISTPDIFHLRVTLAFVHLVPKEGLG